MFSKYLRLISLGLAGLIIALLFSLNFSAKAQQPKTITLVSYAVTQSAYSKIIPQFVADWKKKTGQDVVFRQSYAGSGTQTKAIINGLEADVAALALAGDTKKLEKAGLIKSGWENKAPNGAIVTKSVITFITREKGIKPKKWSDLANENVKVITASPKTSGGAQWNFLGLWGSIALNGGTDAQAKAFVEKIYRNIPVPQLPKDAREASDVFYKRGRGNVLLNYENEAILAKKKGSQVPYYVPTDYNISIDNPVAVVDKNIDKHGTRKIAEAFVKYLFTPQAQREFAKVGFRPVNDQVAKEFASEYPTVKKLVTVKDFGGWGQIQTKFFADKAVFDQIIAKR
ncbi:sulfate ABC transporter substrate-binding protein [Geminocystis sp. NIES-3709]|uniref:sulfate ABC transporter substrate-binding protein n=1 Tax=Geminocystis sp. NIES-3709 TaxID=1617448 RepID=UPI0005FCBCDF|nr:sulfate ABC transporter substrate-binding protein [Geminocystis sp. NIES-3709]BAQ66759.1 sulfate and thiosulfate binding protein CysP [Geminocystis sp. NIES-3709]